MSDQSPIDPDGTVPVETDLSAVETKDGVDDVKIVAGAITGATVQAKVDPEYLDQLMRLVDWTKAKAAWGAIAAALTAALLVLGPALDGGVTGQEWTQVVLAALGTPAVVGTVVYRVPNKARRKKEQD